MKMEIKPRKSEITPTFEVIDTDNETNTLSMSNTTVEFLDSVMEARDELFDKQFKDNFKAHRKLTGLLLK